MKEERVRFYTEEGKQRFLSPDNWNVYKKRKYQVLVQKGDPKRIYNVPGRPGIVYNYLEDSRETVSEDSYIITGLAGEMYPVSAENLVNYDVDPVKIEEKEQKVWTRPGIQYFEAVYIPAESGFEIEIPGMGILYGNNRRSMHGDGDYILRAVGSEEYRIINGVLFPRIYVPCAVDGGGGRVRKGAVC